MSFNEILNRTIKIINSCDKSKQIRMAKKYCYMLIFNNYKEEFGLFPANEPNMLIRFIDEKCLLKKIQLMG